MILLDRNLLILGLNPAAENILGILTRAQIDAARHAGAGQ